MKEQTTSRMLTYSALATKTASRSQSSAACPDLLRKSPWFRQDKTLSTKALYFAGARAM